MGTPLLAALREAYPDAHLTWLVEHSQTQAIEANPYIDEYIRWDGGYWTRMSRKKHYHLWLIRALQFQTELRERGYDVFVSFQPEEWPLLTYGTGASTTVGVFDTFRRYYRATRTSGYTRFYTHAYADPDLPDHRSDQYLLTLKALGLSAPHDKKMTMGFTAEDAAMVENFLEKQDIGRDEPFVVLAPMTTWPTKCWPPERYIRLGNELADKYGCRCVISCSEQERSIGLLIATSIRRNAVLAAGNLGFRQMAALISRAVLVVCGDTGPLHVSAAVGTPYIGLFGPTSPHWYAPQHGRGLTLSHSVACGPCDQKYCLNIGPHYMQCMSLVTVAEVLKSVEVLLPKVVAS